MNTKKFKTLIRENLSNRLDSFVRSTCDIETDGGDICDLTRKEVVDILIQISDLKFTPAEVDYMVKILSKLKRMKTPETEKYEDIIKRIINFNGNIRPSPSEKRTTKQPQQEALIRLKDGFIKFKKC